MRLRSNILRGLAAAALAAAAVSAPGAKPVQAGGVVTDCSNQSQFSTVLIGGGTVTFACGTAQIDISSAKVISVDTLIDGGNTITLSGQDTYRLFVVQGGATLTLRNIVLTHGYSSGDGGAIHNSGDVSLDHVTIRDSESALSGGAIYSTGPLTITHSLLEGNQAINAGALFPRFASARTTIVNSILRDNHAVGGTGLGGAILAWDGVTVTISGSQIYNNTAYYGAGYYNFTGGLGSLLELRHGTRLQGNVASFGGGVYNASGSTVSASDVTFEGNEASGAGGGLFNAGVLTLTRATLYRNEGSGEGGGLHDSGVSALTNVTFSGNTSGSGGGLLRAGKQLTTLTHVTFSGNSASTGGGIRRTGGTVALAGSILAHGSSGANCSGSITQLNSGENFASDATCGFGAGHDSVAVLLGPLTDNGGLTPTHLLLSGSPLIDGVLAGCPPPATDQRGGARPVDGDGVGGAACDAGAVEVGARWVFLYLPLIVR